MVIDTSACLESADIEVVAVDLPQSRIARRAFAHFGNCFAYALARQLGEPLLCKGDDFRRTDLALVPSPG